MLLAPIVVIIFQFEALPGCLAGTLTFSVGAIVLFAVAGNKKAGTIHARDRLHIVSPADNQMNESKQLYGFLNS